MKIVLGKCFPASAFLHFSGVRVNKQFAVKTIFIKSILSILLIKIISIFSMFVKHEIFIIFYLIKYLKYLCLICNVALKIELVKDYYEENIKKTFENRINLPDAIEINFLLYLCLKNLRNFRCANYFFNFTIQISAMKIIVLKSSKLPSK